MRVILIVDGVVGNVIEADSVARAQAAHPQALAVAGNGVVAAIGDRYDAGAFTPPAPEPEAPPPLSRLDFLRRFTAAQRIAIRAAAATDPIIADAMALLDAADTVRLDNPDTVGLTGYLVAVGLITAADRAAILAP